MVINKFTLQRLAKSGTIVLALTLLILQPVPELGITSTIKAAWPPEGIAIRCPITRDTGISSVGEEKIGNNGGSEQLKLKSQQELILFDIDPAPLKGKVVTGAILHIRSASPQETPLARVGVSTVASPWSEGSSKKYRTQIGSACFNQAAYQRQNWAYEGSTIMDVAFGRGHSIWKFSDCTQPDKDGWQACAVDPDVVAARVAGISQGFSLYDELGNIWSIEKGQFSYTYFPNRSIYSRESEGSTPWLEVWVRGADSAKAGRIDSIKVHTESMPAGEALLTWKTPLTVGVKKTLGFTATYKINGQDKEFPRYLIPMAGRPGEEVKMHIQGMSFGPNDVIAMTIWSVDSTGITGQPFTSKIKLSAGHQMLDIPETDIKPFPFNNNLPKIGKLKVSVVDLLDKIDPRTGIMIPAKKDGYKGGNHLYSAEKRLIRLQSARNETVAFQLNLEGVAQNISVDYIFDQNRRLKTRLYEFAYVHLSGDHGNEITIAPDPLVPLKGMFSIPSTSGVVRIPDQKNHSLICELYVPHEEAAGKKRGKLTIKVGEEAFTLDVDLTIWDFTLPNKLSFIPEMNAYGMVPFYNEPEYYRLAHEHRTCLNWLPYGWNGVPLSAPKWKGDRFDWVEWDHQVRAFLDGSAFKDLPRKGEPVDVFYLPFNENWPINLFKSYRASYWADEAFDNEYSKELINTFALFAKHCDESKWHDTFFQFYLNNKVYYRKNFKGSSAPWIFDEPMNTQDFWALRWYGILWHSGVHETKGNAKMWFRGDISYGQFGRDMLRGIMDVEYIGDNNPQKTRMKQTEQVLWGPSYFAEYGTANRIDAANTQPVLWCLSAWARNSIGVLPWQTIGGDNSWKTGEQTALFYPYQKSVVPSVRLKAFTRGQQDVEYLMLVRDVFKKPHYSVAEWLGKSIDVRGQVVKNSAGDAGTEVFEKGDILELWKLRYRIGKALSGKAPKYKRALVNWESPRWDIKRLPDIGYVQATPRVERYKPLFDSFGP
jgi:hypothetical protein